MALRDQTGRGWRHSEWDNGSGGDGRQGRRSLGCVLFLFLCVCLSKREMLFKESFNDLRMVCVFADSKGVDVDTIGAAGC